MSIDAEKIIEQLPTEGLTCLGRDKFIIRLLCAELARLEQRIDLELTAVREADAEVAAGATLPPPIQPCPECGGEYSHFPNCTKNLFRSQPDRMVSLKRVREIVRLSAFNFVYVNEALDAEFGKET